MDEEIAAQRKLSTLWVSTAGSIRDRCEDQAVADGTHSYVDDSCIEEADSPPSSSPQKGASKKRKPNQIT
jgi:hypothetical protein